MLTQRFKVTDNATAATAGTGLSLIGNALIREVDVAAGVALKQFGPIVIEVTNPRVPRKTGALRNSAKFFATKEGSFLHKLLVTYGGVAPSFPQIIDDMAPAGFSPEGEVTYAEHVHEVPAKKGYSTPGTGFKYLTFGGFSAVPKAYAIFRKAIVQSVSKYRIN